MPDFFMGVDLGQARDPSAVAIVERSVDLQLDLQSWNRVPRVSYAVRHLERVPLGTPYPGVVSRVAELLARPELPGCQLVIDATGVGRPVLDLFHAAGLAVVPVMITAGDRAALGKDGIWRVPKRDLVVGLAVMLQAGELLVAHGLGEREVFLRELMNFKVKVSAEGRESFSAWRESEHDDLVLAVALACWRARRPRALAGRRQGPVLCV
jgi:hypothetical protein